MKHNPHGTHIPAKEDEVAYDLPRRVNSDKTWLAVLTTADNFPHGCRGRVLVIESDALTRIRLCLMLVSCKCEPVFAEAENARDLYLSGRNSERPYGAVILDIHSAPALHTVAKLRQVDPDVKVIASGFNPRQDSSSAPDGSSFSGRLQKPYRIDQLRRTLERVLSDIDVSPSLPSYRFSLTPPVYEASGSGG